LALLVASACFAQTALYAAAAFAATPDPVIVRDAFNLYTWYIYVPADADGDYWSRWTLTNSHPDQANTDSYIYIREVFYGRVREGETFTPYGAADWSENAGGSWADSSAGCWLYRMTSAQNDYAEITVPAGHNIIQLITYDVSGGNGANLQYSFDGSTGTYDSGTATNVTVTTCFSDAVADGSKKFRVTHNDAAGTARIIGIRTFNSGSSGDPSTTRSANTAQGHDLITIGEDYYTQFGAKFNAAGFAQGEDNSLDSTVQQLSSNNTNISFYLSSCADGGAKLGTGGWAHTDPAANAPFTYLAADLGVGNQYEDGPNLFVNGVDKGDIWGSGANPLRRLYTGGEIYFYYDGFVDWDAAADEGTRDAAEPYMWVAQQWNKQGYDISVAVAFEADTDVDKCYGPEWKEEPTSDVPAWRFPPDWQTTVTPSTGHQHGYSEIAIEPSFADVWIKLMGTGPCDSIYYESDKSYVFNDLDGFDGGTDPAAGMVWSWGGRIEIRAIETLSLGGDYYRARYDYQTKTIEE